MMIVEEQSPRELPITLGRGSVEPRIDPPLGQRAMEPLDLPVVCGREGRVRLRLIPSCVQASRQAQAR